MTEHRTILHINPKNFPSITHEDKLFFIGSCFSDVIGQRFEELKFNVLSNPFGVTYNPLSITKQIDWLVKGYAFSNEDTFEKDGLFNSFDLHKSFDSSNREDLVDKVNETISFGQAKLQNARFVFITLGTAWVYKHLEKEIIVNNCHQFPLAATY